MIECKYGNQKRLFINHLGELIPCCYVNSESLNMLAGNQSKTLFGELNAMYDNSLYNNTIQEEYFAGYFNVATALTQVQFKMDSGNFDGTI